MTGRCTGGRHQAPAAGGSCPCGAVSRHPVSVTVRDGLDEQASHLWAERHNHPSPFNWHLLCPACNANAAEGFRLGYRAGLASADPAAETPKRRALDGPAQ